MQVLVACLCIYMSICIYTYQTHFIHTMSFLSCTAKLMTQNLGRWTIRFDLQQYMGLRLTRSDMQPAFTHKLFVCPSVCTPRKGSQLSVNKTGENVIRAQSLVSDGRRPRPNACKTDQNTMVLQWQMTSGNFVLRRPGA